MEVIDKNTANYVRWRAMSALEATWRATYLAVQELFSPPRR